MPIRRQPEQRRGRRDGSQVKLPPIGTVTVAIVAHKARLTCDQKLVFIPFIGGELQGPTDLYLWKEGDEHTFINAHFADTVVVIDDYNVDITFADIEGDNVEEGDTIVIGPGMRGLRTVRGGQLSFGQYTFPD